MAETRFATAINCIDGRTQIPVTNFLKAKFGVDFIDMVTEAGPVKALAEGGAAEILASLKRRVEVSIKAHGSSAVGIGAHEDCAGNPVSEEVQVAQLRKAAARVRSWCPEVEVALLWVGVDGSVREVEDQE